MSNIRTKLSHLTAKKVPALALVLVATVGMVVGVLAANLAIGQTTNTGEIGTLHTSSGIFTITDTGLAVVANTVASNATTAFTIAATGVAFTNALTAGHWMDVVTFLDNTPAAGTHIATLTFRNGAGPQGTSLVSVTSGTWTTATTSTGTVTFYVDLGVLTLTSPTTAYISIT